MDVEQRIRAIALIEMIEENPEVGSVLGVEVSQEIRGNKIHGAAKEVARVEAEKPEMAFRRKASEGMEGVRP